MQSELIGDTLHKIQMIYLMEYILRFACPGDDALHVLGPAC